MSDGGQIDGWWSTVVADHAALQAGRERYDDRFASSGLGSAPRRIVRDLVTNVGFQQLAVFRLAQRLHRRGLTPIAMVVSRLVRHVYGAEMHWEARIAPGIVVVHGNGLVVSRSATVGPGCSLSQHVTLGISRGADGRGDGAPVLVRDVHVGPGAVLVGPIEVGAGAKIAPNAVVLHDVPSNTVVMSPPSEVRMRSPRPEESR